MKPETRVFSYFHESTSGNPDKERKTRATIFGGGSVEFSTIFQVSLPHIMLEYFGSSSLIIFRLFGSF